MRPLLRWPLLLWTKGPAGVDVALEWIILLERSARFLQVCLLIVAIALMSRLGLTGRIIRWESLPGLVFLPPWIWLCWSFAPISMW